MMNCSIFGINWCAGFSRISAIGIVVLFLPLICCSQQPLTNREQDEIRYQARKKIEKNLPELLNTLSLSDLTEFERLTLIQDSYLPGPGQLFFNDNIIVEDDIDPGHTNKENMVDTPIEKYLRNFDLFYVKGEEPSVRVTNVVVSPVSEKPPFFVRVYFTIQYSSKHARIDKPYQLLHREAELRAEKLDRKWELFIARIGFQSISNQPAAMVAAAEKDTAAIKDTMAIATVLPPVSILEPSIPSLTEDPRRKAVFWKATAGVLAVGSVVNFLIINGAYGKYKTQLSDSNSQYQIWHRSQFGSEANPSVMASPMSLLSFGKPGVYFSGLGILASAASWWLGAKYLQKAREKGNKTSLLLEPEAVPAYRYAGLSVRLKF